MVDTDPSAYVLPFTPSDFPELSTAQYDAELIKAVHRAYYYMQASCDTDTGLQGWGISQTDLDADVSGRLQLALQLLTAYEFLKLMVGLIGQRNLMGSYSSPTGESITRNPESMQAWIKLKDSLYSQAYEEAYDYLSECAKSASTGLSIANYNWQTLSNNYLNDPNSYSSDSSCFAH